MSGYDFMQNKECEYFPCHKCDDPESFSCLFCYCPLYALGDKCGGNFAYTEQGVKDCSGCLVPHRRENYDRIVERITGMAVLKKCPKCGVPPKIGYCCGEYLIYGEDPNCPYCGEAFTEMHSSEALEIEAWNRRAESGKVG